MHVPQDLMWRVLCKIFWELNGALISLRKVPLQTWRLGWIPFNMRSGFNFYVHPIVFSSDSVCVCVSKLVELKDSRSGCPELWSVSDLASLYTKLKYIDIPTEEGAKQLINILYATNDLCERMLSCWICWKARAVWIYRCLSGLCHLSIVVSIRD